MEKQQNKSKFKQ